MTAEENVLRKTSSSKSLSKEGRAELDSHADTTCLGSGFVMIGDAVKTCSVEPFLETYQPVTEIPVGTCITAYDDPASGQTFILQFHQALFFGNKMKVSLLNPNQMRLAGNTVNDCPKHLSEAQSSSHSIITPDLEIHLDLNGVVSGFNTRVPNDNETENCIWVDMTDAREW